jgi:hypothetical protein
MTMRSLTAEGQERLAGIARRHGVSDDAARSMLAALTNGGGTMAQFSHPEFGGAGQWMQGGMTMVSDLFNNALKAAVDGLCNDLAALLLNPAPGTWREDAAAAGFGGGSGGGWWPSGLGTPNASGAQNDLRYAYFADARRLAVEIAGALTLYDTGDHRISGVSQQQGDGWTLTFTSQYGTVPLSSLRVVDGGGPTAPSMSPPWTEPQPSSAQFTQSNPPQPNPPQPNPPQPPPAQPTPAQSMQSGGPLVLENSVWAFGPAEGRAATTLALAADGGVTGGDDARVRYWSVEDDGLTFYDADGRPSVRFALPSGGMPASGLTGQDPNRPGQTYFLRSPTAATPDSPAPVAAPSAALPVDLTVGAWSLEDVAGNWLCGLRLLPDGRVEGGRGGEAAWRITGHSLVFLHGSGRPTARFDLFQFRAGQWTVIGAPLNNESVSLFLKQA